MDPRLTIPLLARASRRKGGRSARQSGQPVHRINLSDPLARVDCSASSDGSGAGNLFTAWHGTLWATRLPAISRSTEPCGGMPLVTTPVLAVTSREGADAGLAATTDA